MLFWRVSKSAKSTVNNSRGLLFDAYQERLGEICNELPRLCGEHVFRWGQYRDEEKNGRSYKCKDRVSIDLGRGDNSRITGYVVQVAERFVTYVHEDTLFWAAPVFDDANNFQLMHIRPYIGEVVECFDPIERV